MPELEKADFNNVPVLLISRKKNLVKKLKASAHINPNSPFEWFVEATQELLGVPKQERLSAEDTSEDERYVVQIENPDAREFVRNLNRNRRELPKTFLVQRGSRTR